MGGLSNVALLAALAVCTTLLGCKGKGTRGEEGALIKVLRVQNPSDDRSGAEHCVSKGSSCRPLAPGQEIPRSGLVRTFAGSSVTLDLGQGRHIDLGPLSETELGPASAELVAGEVGLSASPLIAKESASAFDFVVGRRKIQLDSARSTLAHLSVFGDSAAVTVRRGQLRGPDVDGLSAGDTIRLTSAGAFRTSSSGRELAALPYVGAQRRDFGELWPAVGEKQVRGLGTMTARIPNTDQVRSGVRLAKHQVEVTIIDGVARTEVVEEFANETDQILEGRFRFPVPSDAAISRLGLWVGNELVEGEVVEAERARQIYSSIVDRPVPRDPALLEWVTAGEMSLKVFPILPKKSRRVVLAYDQLLPVEGGRFRYSYPLSLGEGRENSISELSIALHVLDTQGEIDSLRVLSHDARVGREGPWASAYFSQRNVTAARDLVLVVERRGGPYLAVDTPQAAEVPAPALGEGFGWRGPRPPARFGHYAARVTVDLPPERPRPRSIVADRAIVLDVSYSQSRETVRAQAALAWAIVSELEPEEGFVLLACDSACAVHAAPAGRSEDRREGARSFLAALAPGGASDLAGALVAASVELGRLTNGPRKSRQLVLLSDGQASSGELSPRAIARVASQHLTPANIDLRLVGVGRKLDHGQLENLAIELDAALDFLPAVTSLEERVFEIAIGLRRPVVRGAHVELPLDLTLAGTSRLPALRLGQEVVLTGELLSASPGKMTISGSLEGSSYQIEVVAPTTEAKRSPFVASLFARQRIQKLLAEEPSELQRDAIVRLSTSYRTMSPYTSFLVLENEEMFRRFGIHRGGGKDEGSTTPDAFMLGRLRTAEEQTLPADAMPLEKNSSESERLVAAEPSAESALEYRRATKATSAPKPPMSAPAPAKAKKAAGSGGGAESRPASPPPPADAPLAKGTAPGLTDSWIQGDPLSGPLDDDLPGAYVRRHWAPPPPRAHLSSYAANDAWRTWAVADLEQARIALEQAPESRARLEDFIRRHLAQGRFFEAMKVARRFVDMDPDHLLAQDLLAQAAVVSGDHELGRRMLDVQVETSPRQASLHLQAARAFENAGDAVRACAHRRSLAELQPNDSAGTQRAANCWAVLLGQAASVPPPPASSAENPQLRVEVQCDAGTPVSDCPAPVVVAPDGRVTSPWTPGTGDSSAKAISLPKVRTGPYFVLVLGGAPGVKGRVALTGRHEKTSVGFVAEGLNTVAKVEVRFY